MTSWLDAPAVAVARSGPVSATVTAPASKSVTNRALLVAALADGTSRLTGPLRSSDTEAMSRAVEALGARVVAEPEAFVVHGTGGQVAGSGVEIDCGLSGTTMRFVAAAAALAPQPVVVTGDPPLLRRPVGSLTAALNQLGATAGDTGGFPPMWVGGGLAGGAVEVDVSASSQYLSAVLLAAPYAGRDVTASALGQSADAYIAMTAQLMRRWGADVEQTGAGQWWVRAGRGYQGREEAVEYDASAAAHLYALAAASGGTITVDNVASDTLQPDAHITGVLSAMGCSVTAGDTSVTVTGPPRLQAVDVDMSAMPDQVTTVAALAAVAEGTSHITGVGVTRGHETDRLAALATELGRLGVSVSEDSDALTIVGGTATGPARLATYGDHRLAMAFTALGLAVDGISVADPACVAKTYPGFFDDLVAAGVGLRVA